MQLWDKEGNCPTVRTPAELADMAGVTRATMTGLVETLERDGFVRREPAPGDRRMMSVHLTPRGETLLKELLPPHFRLMGAIMAPLTHEERKQLVRLLAKILPPTTEAPVGLDLDKSSVS